MLRKILGFAVSKAPIGLLKGSALAVRRNLDIQKKAAARSRLSNTVQGWRGDAGAVAPRGATEMLAADPASLSVDDQERLGMMYFKGDGINQDYTKAYKTWQAAADRGSPGALFSVSGCLLTGMGVAKDEKAAFAIVRDLALQRNYPLAHYQLACCYIAGTGTEPSIEKAVTHMEVSFFYCFGVVAVLFVDNNISMLPTVLPTLHCILLSLA
jgi:TPR repeat protein